MQQIFFKEDLLITKIIFSSFYDLKVTPCNKSILSLHTTGITGNCLSVHMQQTTPATDFSITL